MSKKAEARSPSHTLAQAELPSDRTINYRRAAVGRLPTITFYAPLARSRRAGERVSFLLVTFLAFVCLFSSFW